MNYYAKTMDIMRATDQAVKLDLLWRIAKSHPKKICDAAKDLNICQEEPWKTECRDLAKTNKLAAIKIWRGKTGAGLKEAKEAVEAL